MEVKINREIRDYTESMFFGLNMRQFVFSLQAVAVAVVIYFVLHDHFGIGTLSWMCVLGAAPFAGIGFIKYNGLTCEQFIWAWLKSEFIIPRELHFCPTNTYYDVLCTAIEKHEQEGLKRHD
jgi:hypothetical protein